MNKPQIVKRNLYEIELNAILAKIPAANYCRCISIIDLAISRFASIKANIEAIIIELDGKKYEICMDCESSLKPGWRIALKSIRPREDREPDIVAPAWLLINMHDRNG